MPVRLPLPVRVAVPGVLIRVNEAEKLPARSCKLKWLELCVKMQLSSVGMPAPSMPLLAYENVRLSAIVELPM